MNIRMEEEKNKYAKELEREGEKLQPYYPLRDKPRPTTVDEQDVESFCVKR